MKKKNVIRAWRDEEYRRSLSEEERAMLPDHPAGMLDVADDEVLGSVTGGCNSGICSWQPCGNSTVFASCVNGEDICI